MKTIVSGGAPLYLQIAETMEGQIKRAVLQWGDKLPSLRTVCREFGVSMNTAIQAYLELEKRALIESRPQSGYYVSYKLRSAVPDISKPMLGSRQEQADELIASVYKGLSRVDITRFCVGVPDKSLLPLARLNKSLLKAMRSLPQSGTAYDDVQGNQRLRRAVARWSFTWGATLTEGDIVTTAGAMNAITYAMMALSKPGDTIALESPVFFGILQLARSLGLKVIELPTHPQTGVDPDALKKLLPKIRLCLLVSNFNNPLGSCMPEENKKEIVRLLARAGIPLIEDDIYGDVYFGESRPKPCKAFDEEGNVLWCGSVSKTLAPGYRVGWIAPGRFKEEVLRLKMLQTISTTTITQEVIGDFMESGRYEQHLRKMRRALYANSLRFISTLDSYFPEGTKMSRPQGGFVLWTELPGEIDTAALYEKALRQKISIAPGRMFSLQEQFTNCMRLSYGMSWSLQLENKLKQLGTLAKQMLR